MSAQQNQYQASIESYCKQASLIGKITLSSQGVVNKLESVLQFINNLENAQTWISDTSTYLDPYEATFKLYGDIFYLAAQLKSSLSPSFLANIKTILNGLVQGSNIDLAFRTLKSPMDEILNTIKQSANTLNMLTQQMHETKCMMNPATRVSIQLRDKFIRPRNYINIFVKKDKKKEFEDMSKLGPKDICSLLNLPDANAVIVGNSLTKRSKFAKISITCQDQEVGKKLAAYIWDESHKQGTPLNDVVNWREGGGFRKPKKPFKKTWGKKKKPVFKGGHKKPSNKQE